MRIGVFGGTFDPPHTGHLIVGADACAALGLDRLLWIPAARPPHKGGRVLTPALVRLAMVRAALRGNRRFRAEKLELERPGPSFTVDTLRALTESGGGCELFLLVGADNLREFASWREPEQILQLARLVVLERGGVAGEGEGAPPALHVPVTRVDISSTEIRRRVAVGESIRYLVPDAVRRIVERERLYRS